MRLGLVDTWMSERYLPFWRAYLRGLGAELLEPRLPVSEALARLEEPWPRPARLLAARVLELKARGAEAILVPEAVGESPRGTGTCPWAVDPASMLERVLPGLPPLVRVPPSSRRAFWAWRRASARSWCRTPRRSAAPSTAPASC